MPAGARSSRRSGRSGSGRGGGSGRRRVERPSFASVLGTASLAFFWPSSSRPPCLAQAASADSSSRGSFLAAGPPFSLKRRCRQGRDGAGVGDGSAGAIRSLVSEAARGYDRHAPRQHQQSPPVDGPWGTRTGIVGGGAGGSAVTLRGGGGARRTWFTGYEDTTQGESSSEEGDTTESYEEEVSEGGTADGDDAADDAERAYSEKRQEEEEEEKAGGRQTGEEDEGKGGDSKTDSRVSPGSKAKTEDIYARTVARRKALALTFRILQRALIRTALLLLAFQIMPWLKNNHITQWLLLGSLLLQTVTELVGVARSADAAGKQGKGGEEDNPAAGSSGKGKGGKGTDKSNASLGVFGGLMKAFTPEDAHGQHLDFHSMNDMFAKDAEALAAASGPKLDIPSLLAGSGGDDGGSSMVGLMKAFKGLYGDKQEAKKKKSKWGGTHRTKKHGTRRGKRKHSSNKRSKQEPESSSASAGEGKKAAGEENGERFVRESVLMGEKADETASVGDLSASASSREGGSLNSTVTASPGKPQKRVFVVSFRPGHSPEATMQKEMDLLSETVSFLVAHGNTTTDEVVVVLESPGGEVTEFGLAAARLARLKDRGFRLTVCVDKVAASGGYMIACIADELTTAPFAMLGSIGVVGGMTNFNKALKKYGVDYFHFTSGQHKSLVGPFQEVTKENKAMQQKQMDAIHSAFKTHVHRYRPSVDIEAVGTGEIWLGQRAVDMRLADKVTTAMEYLQGRMTDAQVFLVKPHKKKMAAGSGLLRELLLGPLAVSGRFASSVAVLSTVLRQLLLQQRPGRAARGEGLLHPGGPRGFTQLTGNGDALARELLGGSTSSAAIIGGGADGIGGGQGGNAVPFGGAKFTPAAAAATGSGAFWDAGDRRWGAATGAEDSDERVF
ncbi:putative periplasmic protease [Ectocarpus siliculosus]|uniref:Periplasmic protease n=1 Tax=Ectocarpus siliculosus TaxID=2880 RepID=D7G353_ECTSI|nr:putative periplasmic protease [Ectocarpus siliculosus]|eukprot:CBJ26900.1 putative periplasmic protease [Ectocarpus siliculosus]